MLLESGVVYSFSRQSAFGDDVVIDFERLLDEEEGEHVDGMDCGSMMGNEEMREDGEGEEEEDACDDAERRELELYALSLRVRASCSVSSSSFETAVGERGMRRVEWERKKDNRASYLAAYATCFHVTWWVCVNFLFVVS